MLYLNQVKFASQEDEENFLFSSKYPYRDTTYPFHIFPVKGLDRINFAPITIFCGGNGSGKTTALNIIAELLKLKRSAPYNKTAFFKDYVALCQEDYASTEFYQGEIITSDDVFDYVMNLRCLNDGVHRNRRSLEDEYRMRSQDKSFRLQSLEDYETLKENNAAKRSTRTSFVSERSANTIRAHSNGESAFRYFAQKFQDGGIYLLDEPENSLSPRRQIELIEFIENSVRFFDCQFIIASHSPFFLGLQAARIYDFDAVPVQLRPWTELATVRDYYDFFEQRKAEFL